IDTDKERESYARLGNKNVVTLQIIKRSGENLLNTADKISRIVDDMKKIELPRDLNVVITGDQSVETRTSFNDLINTIIIGFVLVLLVLIFFMGVSIAFFLSLCVSL